MPCSLCGIVAVSPALFSPAKSTMQHDHVAVAPHHAWIVDCCDVLGALSDAPDDATSLHIFISPGGWIDALPCFIHLPCGPHPHTPLVLGQLPRRSPESTHQECRGLLLQRLQLLEVLQQSVGGTSLHSPSNASARTLLTSTLPAAAWCAPSPRALCAACHTAVAAGTTTKAGWDIHNQRSLDGSADQQRLLGHLRSQPWNTALLSRAF